MLKFRKVIGLVLLWVWVLQAFAAAAPVDCVHGTQPSMAVDAAAMHASMHADMSHDGMHALSAADETEPLLALACCDDARACVGTDHCAGSHGSVLAVDGVLAVVLLAATPRFSSDALALRPAHRFGLIRPPANS